MHPRTFYCVFYILLLTMTTPALCVQQQVEENLRAQQEVEDGSQVRERRAVVEVNLRAQQEVEDGSQVRERRAVAPIAVYVGAAVSPWVWVALVAAYGLSVVLSKRISRTYSDSHSCANNRGWCRQSCFGHEYIDWWNSPVCGNYKCCRPGN